METSLETCRWKLRFSEVSKVRCLLLQRLLQHRSNKCALAVNRAVNHALLTKQEFLPWLVTGLGKHPKNARLRGYRLGYLDAGYLHQRLYGRAVLLRFGARCCVSGGGAVVVQLRLERAAAAQLCATFTEKKCLRRFGGFGSFTAKRRERRQGTAGREIQGQY